MFTLFGYWWRWVTQLPLSQKDKNNCMLSETVVHIHVLQLIFIP